jgi:hypothetical protein
VAGTQDVIAAIQSGNVEQLKGLLAEDRSLAAARDGSGVSALMHALYRQRKDMVDALRGTGLDFDIFEACSLGRSDLVVRGSRLCARETDSRRCTLRLSLDKRA